MVVHYSHLIFTFMSSSYVQSLFDKASASSDKDEVVACLAGLDQVVALERCFSGKDSESAFPFEVPGFWDLDMEDDDFVS